MARLSNRWLLSICLVMLPNMMFNMQSCLAQSGGPPRPSRPRCHIPYEYRGVTVRSAIQCVWDPGPPAEAPSNYTLRWKSADSSEKEVMEVRGSNTSAYIPRELEPSHSELSVWVRAENQHGSVSSPRSSFNTASIMKPATPTIINHSLEPLEIHWESKCSKQGLSEGHCQVRHRVAPDQGWTEEEEEFHGSYYLENVHPYSLYEFQVRCACLRSLLSDWSEVRTVESPEEAPVGLLDVWGDCKTSPKSSECVLMWKRPPRWQARGKIQGYVVTLSRADGTVTVVNTSAVAMPTDWLTCDEKRCHLNITLREVTAATVSVYTAHGATTPACLHMPLSVQGNRGSSVNSEALPLQITSEGLVVFWNLPTHNINNQSEYVVQYKQAGLPPTQGFDWIRLDRSQMSATLTGQFEKYVAYQVALFSVSPNGSSDHISSAVGYVHQGIPSKVPSFEVVSTKATSVVVTWEPIPLPQRRGVILCYQIGVDSQRVYNLSERQGNENKSFLLEHLDPGQKYEVWIRAVTEAGPGPNSTMSFKTPLKDLESFDYNILFLLVLCVPFMSFFLMKKFYWVFKDFIGFKKVPDPSNSHVFQRIYPQTNGCHFHSCINVDELDPVLSQLDIVKPCPDETAKGRTGDGGSQGSMEGVADQGEWVDSGNTTAREQCYSKMTDSDEETHTFPSDYETHFIPTAEDIMCL